MSTSTEQSAFRGQRRSLASSHKALSTTVCFLAFISLLPTLGASRLSRDPSISYTSTNCFGDCPYYQVIVSPAGNGTFLGFEGSTVKIGRFAFTVTADLYTRFKAIVEPLRPAKGSVAWNEETCPSYFTDMSSVYVAWIQSPKLKQQFSFYLGCNDETDASGADIKNTTSVFRVYRQVIDTTDDFIVEQLAPQFFHESKPSPSARRGGDDAAAESDRDNSDDGYDNNE